MLQFADKDSGSHKCHINGFVVSNEGMCTSKQVTENCCIAIRRTVTTTEVKQEE